jgi:hypothetical protein
MHRIEFSLTNTEPLTFKVCGMMDVYGENNGTLPIYLTKDMIVTLVSGKWPLGDYTDCNRHTFVFQKEDGTQFSLLVIGFTLLCSLPKEKQQDILNEGGTHIVISLLEIPLTKDDPE